MVSAVRDRALQWNDPGLELKKDIAKKSIAGSGLRDVVRISSKSAKREANRREKGLQD